MPRALKSEAALRTIFARLSLSPAVIPQPVDYDDHHMIPQDLSLWTTVIVMQS